MANCVNPVKGRQLLDYEITGTYLRKQGGRQQYFYYARLTPIMGGFAWDARILSDEELKGTPSGQVTILFV